MLLGSAAWEDVVEGWLAVVEDSVGRLEVRVIATVLLVITVEVGISDELSLVELITELSEVICDEAEAVSVGDAEVTLTVAGGASTVTEELETSFVAEGRIVSTDDDDAIAVDVSADAVDETSDGVGIDVGGISEVTGRVGMGSVVWYALLCRKVVSLIYIFPADSQLTRCSQRQYLSHWPRSLSTRLWWHLEQPLRTRQSTLPPRSTQRKETRQD